MDGRDIDIGACRSAINVDLKPFISSSSATLAFSGDLDFFRFTGEALRLAEVGLGDDGGGIGGEGGREDVGEGGRTSDPVRPCRLDSPYWLLGPAGGMTPRPRSAPPRNPCPFMPIPESRPRKLPLCCHVPLGMCLLN